MSSNSCRRTEIVHGILVPATVGLFVGGSVDRGSNSEGGHLIRPTEIRLGPEEVIVTYLS